MPRVSLLVVVLACGLAAASPALVDPVGGPPPEVYGPLAVSDDERPPLG
jgi:hypothetical protein